VIPIAANLLSQWRANRRIRLFSAVALLIATIHLAVHLDEARRDAITSYRSNQALLQRLEEAAADAAWTERAAAATAALLEAEASMIAVAGAGPAQAEMQAALSAAAAAAGIAEVAVRTEGAAMVEGLSGIWEVSARLAGAASGPAATALLADLSARRWIRVDRVEIRDLPPNQVQMIVRGYFRQSTDEAIQ